MTFEELKEFHDNTLDKEKWEVPKVRLFTQDEVEAMFTELQLEIEEIDNAQDSSSALADCKDVIQQKINALKAESEPQESEDKK